jgi:hypothetical protein
MLKKNDAAMCRAIAELIAAVNRLNDKVDRCTDLCEGILDEVTPLGLAMDAIAADAPLTMD